MLDTKQLNTLALQAQDGNEFAMNDLFQEVYPIIKNFATTAANRGLARYGYDVDDYESTLVSAFLELVKKYDAKIDFLACLTSRLRNRVVDVTRKRKTHANEILSSAKRFDEAITSESSSNSTKVSSYHDVIPSTENVEETVIEKSAETPASELVRKFTKEARSGERYGIIIEHIFIHNEEPNDALARQLGFDRYNNSVSSLVARAKKSFAKFGLSQDLSDLYKANSSSK